MPFRLKCFYYFKKKKNRVKVTILGLEIHFGCVVGILRVELL